jgi:hypothetical protein
MWRPAVVAFDLSQGAFKTARGFLQLALESFDLLRYILKLSFSKHSSLGDLVGGAIRSTDCAPDFHCDSCESALSGHVYPPLGTHAILHHTQDYAVRPSKKHGSKDRHYTLADKAPATARGRYISGEFQVD